MRDCSNFEQFPANLQCPAANCTVQPNPPPTPTYHVIWIGISTTFLILLLRVYSYLNIIFNLIISIFLTVLFSFCCYRCTRRQHQQPSHSDAAQQQQEERRPLLERLRLRQRLADRPQPGQVEMHEISRPISVVPPDGVLEGQAGSYEERPIYRGGARPRATASSRPRVSLDYQSEVARVSGLGDSRRGIEVKYYFLNKEINLNHYFLF